MAAEHERCDQYEYTHGKMKAMMPYEGSDKRPSPNPALSASAQSIRAEQTRMVTMPHRDKGGRRSMPHR